MSYLVLARKYRPTTFAEVVGQDHVTRTLKNAFAAGRVHHAFLFTGPRGCGKTTLARIVGKALNCERFEGGEPCGTCSACTTIANGSAVDYVEIDGASNRGIDAIRDLTEAVRYQPAQLKKKVYVIDEVHMLTTEAFNAMLKTLEEPPPHVTFVLATTEVHKLPNTILSRCQRYDFKLVPSSKLAAHLARIFGVEKIDVEPGATGLIVRESGGSVRDALSLSDQVISFVGDAKVTEEKVAEVLGVADRALTRRLVEALAAGNAGDALAAAEQGIERGVDEVQLARATVRYLRDLAVLQAAPKRPELVDASEDERKELAAQAAAIDKSRVSQMFERMLRCCDELGRTLQPRVVLDCALIDVAAVEPLVPLGDLIDRLGEIEARVAGGGGGGGGGSASRSSGGGGGGGGSVRAPQQVRNDAPRSSGGGYRAEGTEAATTRVASASTAPATTASTSTSTGTITATATSTITAAPTSTGNGANGIKTWDAVLSALEAKREMVLLGLFEHARLVSWVGDVVELGFPFASHSLGEMAKEADRLGEIKTFLKNHYGAPITVNIRLLDEKESQSSSQRSVLEETRERTMADRKKREAEAREHPMTKLVLNTFGAQIKEIKTDV